ncbi:hypothetical protein ITJ57_17555 [Plantibacter sp. VKM Ac-2880]|uniref:hypothetical protein n=1 Tax=Plantibacter sp. VKM Ac-2880 TaxID=2783827 RepID=UPI00188F509E|nr:hypothetical protein [Plantibacter sp. VKM Ac-2880]MBF4570576.1 hypothetical protein [Plantibacter sp. VKM Ac-2880]
MPEDRDHATTPPTDLVAAAVALLRRPLPTFVAERKRLATAAREHGDTDLATAILALRKPSVAAWALNVLAAHQPTALDELEQLGAALATAQSAGDGAALRSLGVERRALVSRLVDITVAAAAEEGATLSSTVVETVRQSLQAASADAELVAQLSTGRLTDAPTASGSGWGGVVGGPGVRHDDAEATSERDRQTQDDPAEADDRRRRLLARLDVAEREAGTAEGASEEANSLLDDAAVRRADLLRDREDLARRLDELDADLTDAARELARRQREADRAQRSLDAAREEADRLRAALDE